MHSIKLISKIVSEFKCCVLDSDPLGLERERDQHVVQEPFGDEQWSKFLQH